MEKMLVVVFDGEEKAYEGSRALTQLDVEGSISIHASAIVGRDANGKLAVKQSDDAIPARTVAATGLGSLIGLVGGPVGLGIGAAVGAFAGMIADLRIAGVDGDFLDDVSKALKPGKCAIVADINEEWVTPIDTRMEGLGGVVFRAARRAVVHEQIKSEEASMRGELEALKAERAKVQSERKRHLEDKLEQMEKRVQAKLQRRQQEREQTKRDLDAKLAAVQQRAAKAHGDAKAALEARVNDMRREYESSRAGERAASGGATQHH